MIILGLDISTKTGYAVMTDRTLMDHGILRCDETVPDQLMVPDYGYIEQANNMAHKIHCLVSKYNPDFIYIEQTNAGSFRNSQKQLEFIHCIVLTKINECCRKAKAVRYIDTSAWRSLLGIRLNKDQKKHNSTKSKAKRAGKRDLALASIGEQKARGRITAKHLAVWFANEQFGLKLKLKDNDIADAICVALSGQIVESAQNGFDTSKVEALFT